MLTLIATSSRIDPCQLKIGDVITGYYMGEFPFEGQITQNRCGYITYNGHCTDLIKFSVKLLTDCKRPQDGLFEKGETILINLNGDNATQLVMHSR